DDAFVGLMRYQPGDVVSSEVVSLHNLGTDIGHVGHGKLKHGRTLLIGEMFSRCKRLGTGRLAASSGLHMQIGSAGSIGLQDRVLDSKFFSGWLEQNRSCTVTKENAGGSVLIVHDCGHLIRTDYDYLFVCASLDKLRTELECIQKSGASGADVKAVGFFGTNLIRNEIG